MINDLVVGISRKLGELFDYSIYSEDVSQELTPPCFYVRLLQPMLKQYMGLRFYITGSFDIQFFPEQNGTEQSQCQAVADRLILEMSYITVTIDDMDLTCRGKGISLEIVDGVLHFFVQYSLKMRKEVAGNEIMENLTHSNLIKE
ncbi:MAG TPA: hypothetical protein VN441_16705 [Syntrophomonas sp.]|nr:hypothetical protein [Syntrophomonas sp.]